ncbi:MAG: hypothetical protein LBE78_13065 [Burkholderiaceae bacterium]|jgi:hypothetical protein|nr:hypothetical protein [Burkholderiaceae bacterium]
MQPQPLNSVQRAVLDWLRKYGPATAGELREEAANSQSSVWVVVSQGNDRWAEDCLYELYVAGHLVRERIVGDMVYGVAVSDTPTPVVVGLAMPRTYDVMRAPPLTRDPGTPVRAGAMDYAKHPSLISGRRVPCRAAGQTTNQQEQTS